MLEFRKEDKTAVIIVDMVNDCIRDEGVFHGEGTKDIIENIKKLLDFARKVGNKVIYIQHLHRKDLSDFGISHYFEEPSSIEGTFGAEIIKELKPEHSDIVVNKRRYDAFFGTELDSILRTLQIKNLIVTGVFTGFCVFATVVHARSLDYKVCMVSDCTADYSVEDKQAALRLMSKFYSRVCNLKEVFKIFGPN